jgi:hypothetical protein
MRNKLTFYALSTALAPVIGVFLYSNAPAIQSPQPDPPSPSALLVLAGAAPHESLPTLVAKIAKKDKPEAKEKPTWRKAQLRWNAQPGVKGYKVYMGTASRSYTYQEDVRRRTHHEFKALPDGTYYFAVTSYDDAGRESPYSAEVTKTIPDKD